MLRPLSCAAAGSVYAACQCGCGLRARSRRFGPTKVAHMSGFSPRISRDSTQSIDFNSFRLGYANVQQHEQSDMHDLFIAIGDADEFLPKPAAHDQGNAARCALLSTQGFRGTNLRTWISKAFACLSSASYLGLSLFAYSSDGASGSRASTSKTRRC